MRIVPSEKGKYLGIAEADFYDDPELSNYQDRESRENCNPGSYYDDVGLKGIFYRKLKKHLRILEKEAKIKETIDSPDPVFYEPGDRI